MVKPIEIKIPVLALILSTLLIIASIVIVTIVIVKNKEIHNVTTKYDSIKTSSQIIIKQKTDTIQYYQNLIKNNDNLISNQESLITSLNNRISSFKFKVDKYTPNEIFDSIQVYIEPKNDSLKFKFSGNQIKQIYTEHLELLESKDGLLSYSLMVDYLKSGITLRDREINTQNELSISTQKLLSECENETVELQAEVKNQKDKVKRNRILAPISFIAGAIASSIMIISVK